MIEYTLDSPLRGTGQLTAANMNDASGSKGKPLDGQTIKDLEATSGLNGDLLFAQMCEETGYGTSDIWMTKNNPGGIGAVDGATNDALSFDTPRDGIIADFSHMLTYTDGNANNMRRTDPRFNMIPLEHRGTIRVIGDLGSGVWATDTDYAAKIVRIANSLCARYTQDSKATQGGSMTPDEKYSLPVRLDLQNNSHSFVDRPTNPDGRILAIVKHVTAGETLDGALTWNRNPTVKASAHFYIDKDGTVVQDVSLYNGAWSNGILDHPSLPAAFTDNLPDGANVNDFTISIEHVGNPNDADFPTDAQLTADARLSADLCDHFHIPVDEDHILGHYRFDSVNRPNCPGPHWNFGRDVRAVSDLLNGVSPNERSQQQPDSSGSGSVVNPAASGGSDQQPHSGKPEVAGNSDASGTIAAPDDAPKPDTITLTNGVTATDTNGTATFQYPGTNADGIAVTGRFRDEYGHPDAGYERYGVPRCSGFAATIPGINGVVTVQVFDRAIMVDDGTNPVYTLLSGVMAARYLHFHGVVLPSDMVWV